MCSFHSNICTLDKCDKVVTGLTNGKPLFCKHHCYQAQIMEKWGTLTCSKKSCPRKIETMASGLCRPHKKTEEKLSDSSNNLKKKRKRDSK